MYNYKKNQTVALFGEPNHSPLYIHSRKIENGKNLYLLKSYIGLNYFGKFIINIIDLVDNFLRIKRKYGYKYLIPNLRKIKNYIYHNDIAILYVQVIFKVGIRNFPRIDEWLPENMLISVNSNIEIQPCGSNNCELIDEFFNT